MRESEHFNLFLAEGSDIVNPLVQDVQNYENIDTQMFKNQNAGVQNATELKNGTVHAITRNVPDAQFITFTATSNYTAGETFTVDGVQVTALTVSGETLPTGAYVINSQVLCVLKGTLLTVYGVGSAVADNSLALNGHPDTYFGTKEEVDNAIDTANSANVLVNEINGNLTNPTKLATEDIKNKTNTTIVFPVTYDNYKQLIVRIGCNDTRGQQCTFLYPYIGVNGFSLNWALEGDFSAYSYKIEGFLKNGNALEISTIRRGNSVTDLTIDIYGIKQY